MWKSALVKFEDRLRRNYCDNNGQTKHHRPTQRAYPLVDIQLAVFDLIGGGTGEILVQNPAGDIALLMVMFSHGYHSATGSESYSVLLAFKKLPHKSLINWCRRSIMTPVKMSLSKALLTNY